MVRGLWFDSLRVTKRFLFATFGRGDFFDINIYIYIYIYIYICVCLYAYIRILIKAKNLHLIARFLLVQVIKGKSNALHSSPHFFQSFGFFVLIP
jgi:hypothetical protein